MNLQLLETFVGKKYNFYIIHFPDPTRACVIATDGCILCSISIKLSHNMGSGETIAIPLSELGKLITLSDPRLFIERTGTTYNVGVPEMMTLPLTTIDQGRVPNVAQIIALNDMLVDVNALYSLSYLQKVMDFCKKVRLTNVCHTTTGVDKPICFSDPFDPSEWKIYLMPVEYKK